MARRAYYSFAKLYPRVYRERIRKLLFFAQDSGDEGQWLGSAVVLGVCLWIIFTLIPWVIHGTFSPLWIVVGLLGALFIQFIVYLIVYFKADDRRKRIERALPDALQLMASNLKAGMTPFQSLKLSAKEEFGPLADEINRVASRAMGTENFADVLQSISTRVESSTVDRAFTLFSSALSSGARLAELLSDMAADIAETRKLKQQLVTSTKTYTAFMVFTIIIGTPLLLAISIHFLTIVTGLQDTAGVADIGGEAAGLVGEISISVEFLTKASIIILVGTALLASILIGFIKDGTFQEGFKTAPLMISGVLLMFFVSRFVITNFFGNIF